MKTNYKYSFLFLLIALILCFILNISLGSVQISFSTIIDSFLVKSSEFSNQEYIIQNYRLPKAITAILVGSGLGISGLLMQTLFKNPLAIFIK